MYDYKPDYAEELEKIIEAMEENKYVSPLKNAIYYYIFSDIANEYDRTHTNEEIVENYEKFNYEYEFVRDDIFKLVYSVADENVGYVLDIVYDITKKTANFYYDLGYEDGIMDCKKEFDCGFLSFFKQEIPEIYEQLKANYEKTKGVSENG